MEVEVEVEVEVERALVGGIALVVSVRLRTAIAAVLVRPGGSAAAREPEVRHTRHRRAG
ncbi:MAG: hypothetical protein ABI181_03000 [Mycobacteriaceae bacterium]